MFVCALITSTSLPVYCISCVCMTTHHIKYRDIPLFLQAGDFYRSLSSDDFEGSIGVPTDCFCANEMHVSDLSEFCQLLKVMEFWMLDNIPLGVLNCCSVYEVHVWESAVSSVSNSIAENILPELLIAYPQPGTVPFEAIVERGRWDIILHALSRIGKNSLTMLVAARLGNLRLLKHLHKNGYEWDEDTCAEASEYGQLDCLKYAHENGCPWGGNVCILAAKNGHLRCMQYAHQEGVAWDRIVCVEAALRGHLECLQFAHEHGCPWDRDTVGAAAENGKLDCLEYALACGCPADERATNAASNHNQLACLQLLHQYNVPWSELTPFHAAECADAACLRFLREEGCPWDKDTPQRSALKGALDPLRYALEQGCPYDAELMQFAARGGDLVCSSFLLEDQLMHMDEDVFIVALLHGKLPFLVYILDNGCPYLEVHFGTSEQHYKMYDSIFRQGNPEFIECVMYARERGWAPDQNFVRYLHNRDYDSCIAWYAKEGLL